MTIKPSDSQSISTYNANNFTGRYNKFLCIPTSYLITYSYIQKIEFGVNLIEGGFVFTWDLPNQILRIESVDQTFNLQDSVLSIDTYTNDNSVISIGKNDTQQTNLWIVDFYYKNEIGSLASFTEASFSVLERNNEIQTNPSDPRAIGLEVNALLEYSVSCDATTSVTTTQGNESASATCSLTNFNVLSQTLANILAALSLPNSFTDSISASLSSNNFGTNTFPEAICRYQTLARTASLSGTSFISNGIYRYCQSWRRFGDDSSSQLPARTIQNQNDTQRINLSIYACQTLAAGSNLPNRDKLFSTVSNLVFGLSSITSSACHAFNQSLIWRGFWSTVIQSSWTERWNTMNLNICPENAFIYLRWNSYNGGWEGCPLAVVVQLPKVLRIGSTGGQPYLPSSRYNPGGGIGIPNVQGKSIYDSEGLSTVGNYDSDFSAYLDYNQCEVMALAPTDTGQLLGLTRTTPVNPFSATFLVDPSLITDLSKVKMKGFGASYMLLQSVSAGEIKIANTYVTPDNIEIKSYFVNLMFQQYDLDGQLIPY